MALFHPSGITVDIVGLKCSDRGRSCEEHTVCGSALKIDSLVRFRAEQIDVDGKEEIALAVYWITDGVDRCRVGFLPKHLLKHKDDYHLKLAQVVEFLETSDCPSARAKSHRNHGIARAVLVEAEAPKAEAPKAAYLDCAKRTPTKKRSSPSKKKDKESATKRIKKNV
jgi:hypothetical protein